MRAKEKGSECTWLVGGGRPGRPPKAPSSFPSHRPAASPLGTDELTQGTAEHRHEEHTAEPHRKPRRVSEGGAPWWDYFQSCQHKRGGCKENQQNQISKLSSIHGLEGARAHRRKGTAPWSQAGSQAAAPTDWPSRSCSSPLHSDDLPPPAVQMRYSMRSQPPIQQREQD